MASYLIISQHVNIEIIKAYDEAGDRQLKAVDLLPIAATPIFHLDEHENISHRAPIFSKVIGLKQRKALPYMSYTKEALREALRCRWVTTMEFSEMENLLTGIYVIEGFDDEGYVILNESRCETYRALASKTTFTTLTYTGKKIFKPSDDENLAVVHQILNYPPFNGLRIWSWKCEPDTYADGYPKEMCCVHCNEWYDKSLRSTNNFEEFARERGDDGHKGTVTRAWWDFAHTIKEGDLVLFRDKKNDIIAGVGRFVGDYMYKPEKPNARSCREIEWLSKEHYPSPTHIGEGNTSPMEIDDPKQLKLLLPIITDVLNKA